MCGKRYGCVHEKIVIHRQNMLEPIVLANLK